MHPWLMALTICAMPLGAAVLFFSITRILQLLRESEVARLPAETEADMTFNQAGSYVLHIEHPRFNMGLPILARRLDRVAPELRALKVF
jgi:hypothetical protein